LFYYGFSAEIGEDSMTQNHDIAVVIPCFNHANVLRRTLEALYHQTLQPKEVVVVDDGSVDNAEEVFLSFRPKRSEAEESLRRGPSAPSDSTRDDIRWEFVRFETNRGAPAARNEGARRTTSPFILFLDADAEFSPNALRQMSEALDQHPEASFAYANFLWGAKLFRGKSFDEEALKKQNYIHTSSLMRRADFPGFDETLTKFQDWDLWLTMAEQGKRGVWIDEVLYRIQPRAQGYSRWLPRIAYMIPWQKLGFQPKEVGRYRDAEAIVRKKHGI
jgi:glycosyltransferase involved in cell wall biosynthesis